MNPVLKAGAETAELGVLMGLATLIFFVAMIGWTWWAYAPSRRQQMEAAARLPLDDTEPPTRSA